MGRKQKVISDVKDQVKEIGVVFESQQVEEAKGKENDDKIEFQEDVSMMKIFNTEVLCKNNDAYWGDHVLEITEEESLDARLKKITNQEEIRVGFLNEVMLRYRQWSPPPSRNEEEQMELYYRLNVQHPDVNAGLHAYRERRMRTGDDHPNEEEEKSIQAVLQGGCERMLTMQLKKKHDDEKTYQGLLKQVKKLWFPQRSMSKDEEEQFETYFELHRNRGDIVDALRDHRESMEAVYSKKKTGDDDPKSKKKWFKQQTEEDAYQVFVSRCKRVYRRSPPLTQEEEAHIDAICAVNKLELQASIKAGIQVYRERMQAAKKGKRKRKYIHPTMI